LNKNKEIVKQIEFLVDKILSYKNRNFNYNITEYEKKIDQLVYKLYDLTPEEVDLIEKNG